MALFCIFICDLGVCGGACLLVETCGYTSMLTCVGAVVGQLWYLHLSPSILVFEAEVLTESGI